MSSGGESVRVVACFDRWLWLGGARGSGEGAWVGAVDAVTGWEVSGLGLLIRFDRVLEAVGGVYPVGADEMNRCLRVSFDRGRGIRFWPGEGPCRALPRHHQPIVPDGGPVSRVRAAL